MRRITHQSKKSTAVFSCRRFVFGGLFLTTVGSNSIKRVDPELFIHNEETAGLWGSLGWWNVFCFWQLFGTFIQVRYLLVMSLICCLMHKRHLCHGQVGLGWTTSLSRVCVPVLLPMNVWLWVIYRFKFLILGVCPTYVFGLGFYMSLIISCCYSSQSYIFFPLSIEDVNISVFTDKVTHSA